MFNHRNPAVVSLLLIAFFACSCSERSSLVLATQSWKLPHMADAEGRTPLMLAAIRNDMDLAVRVLDLGVDPDVTDSSQKTALHHAVINNSTVFFKLLEHGVRLDLPDLEGDTPLHAVIRFKRRDMFAKLMENHKIAIDVPNRHGVRPLAMSLIAREYDMARTLVERGADVNAANSARITPLMLAVNAGRSSQPAIVRLFLDRGADLHARDMEGRTALFYAVGKAWLDITEMLLEAGADPTVRDRHNRQLEDYLTGEGLAEERAGIRKMLAKKTVNPSINSTPYRVNRIPGDAALMAVNP